ncbi:MAG: IS21-like element helper ATPase IstB [Anaerolineae bacterium]|nr:IS21-like element helper ATPase IstB [Anaerolineae bacterium]
MNNNQATLERMQQMKLHGMVRAFRAAMESGTKNQFTADELLSHLVDAEWDQRHDRRLARLLRVARFRYGATFEQIDWTLARGLDKNQLLRLSSCRWIEEHRDLIITGPCGTGKSFIATALGHQGCLHGHKVGYWSASKLFTELKMAKADGSYLKELIRMGKLDLVVIDDFGLQGLDAPSRLALLEVLEDRHGRASSLFVSQLPVSGWHQVIGEATVADAICDRIVHTAYRIELKGESARKLYAAGRKVAAEDSR